MASRTIVVHATHLLTRGFLVVSTDRKGEDGEPTNALYAVTGALSRAVAFKEPDRAIAVLDASLDPATLPPLLAPQVAALPALLEAHGFHVVSSNNPANLVASYARAARDAGNDLVVVGADKRLAQLVQEGTWWYDPYKDVRYTEELVVKRFEVPPSRVAGWLALVGDDDVMPGVTGIGKKGATDLVKELGSVEAALVRAEEVQGRTGKMLRASLDSARSEVARATLRTDVALPVPLESLSYRPQDSAALNALYSRLRFFELLDAAPAQDTTAVRVAASKEDATRALETLRTGRAVAIHILTEDPSPVRGELIGVALSAGDGAATYFPFGGAVDVADLAAWLGDSSIAKVGHEIKAACVTFARRGVEIKGIVGDTACASHLEEPSNWAPHELPFIAKQKLQRALPEEDTVRGVGAGRKDWKNLPVADAGAYAGQGADATAALWASFEPTVPREQLDEYLALSEALVRMELTGLVCDREDLSRTGEDFTALSAQLESQIHAIAGKSFNLGSTKQLGAVLFEDLKLPIVKRTKTGWSTATEALERIELAHPIVGLVIRWREVQRLKDNWVTALSAAIDADGRVRSTFHPARTFSGRLVNSQPDLGRVPGRTPEMARIRRAFRARPGWCLMSVDYNQLGLYVLAHLTGDEALAEPLRRQDDLHTLTAAAVLDIPVTAVGPEERQKGKVVNFATFAGQGASALALQLGLPAHEAKQLIERFDRHYAKVRAFQDEQLRLAEERGYIVTLAGRKWPIGGLGALDPQLRSNAERMARRATHEGSVADVSRRGLLRADQALRAAGLRTQALLQVHDEVLFEVPEEELAESARVAAEAMKHAFELAVPLRVGVEVGATWADLEPFSS